MIARFGVVYVTDTTVDVGAGVAVLIASSVASIPNVAGGIDAGTAAGWYSSGFTIAMFVLVPKFSARSQTPKRPATGRLICV